MTQASLGKNITALENQPSLFLGLLQIVIYLAFCLDAAQGRMNRAPNETLTHSWRFARDSLQTMSPTEVPKACYEL